MKPVDLSPDALSVSPRARLLTLLLAFHVSCESSGKQLAEPTLVVSVAHSASSVPVASKVLPKPSTDPLICINGYLEAGEKDLIINRIRRAFLKIDATLVRINPDNFEVTRDDCEGMIAVGGDDLDTRRLPKPTPLHPKTVLTPPHRQTFDENYIRFARSAKKPLLAECLGMQQVAAYEDEGGYLIQHIPDIPSALDHQQDHLVRLNHQASAFGLPSLIRVRSRHHQAVRKPLPFGLEEAGRSPDGLVEAMVSSDGLVWGIMWHPKTKAQQVVYHNFVTMVRERTREKSK